MVYDKESKGISIRFPEEVIREIEQTKIFEVEKFPLEKMEDYGTFKQKLLLLSKSGKGHKAEGLPLMMLSSALKDYITTKKTESPGYQGVVDLTEYGDLAITVLIHYSHEGKLALKSKTPAGGEALLVEVLRLAN